MKERVELGANLDPGPGSHVVLDGFVSQMAVALAREEISQMFPDFLGLVWLNGDRVLGVCRGRGAVPGLGLIRITAP